MAEFANPFVGNIDKKISKTELVQALRVDIASELEAMFLYEAHASASDDALVQKVLRDIRDEEKEHVGELLALMRYLEPETADFLVEGQGEVHDMMKELGIDEALIEKATGKIGK